MIKCFFVDVKSINSDVPRSSFVESDLEELANNILETDGLIRPLILRQTAPEKYTVVEGHREYYAAVKAKEKDIKKAEMVNAFVVNEKNERSAIEQLKLLHDSPANIPRDRADTLEIIDLLLPALVSTIERQIQPLVTQLAEQKHILESLRADRDLALTIPEVIVDKVELPQKPPKPVESVEPIIIPVPPQIVVIPPKVTKPPKPPKSKEPKTPKTQKSPTPKATKAPKSPPPQSPPAPTTNIDNSFRSPRAIEVIDLIDKLSREQLTIRMQRSSISQPILKLIDDIIDARDAQAAGKFHTWETIVDAKIKGLGAARIQEIIEKLK